MHETWHIQILQFIAKTSGYSEHTIKGFLYNHSDLTCQNKIASTYNILVENDYPCKYSWNNFQDCPALLNLKMDLELWGKVRREQKRTGRPKGSPNKTTSHDKLYNKMSSMFKTIFEDQTKAIQKMCNTPRPVYITTLSAELKSELVTELNSGLDTVFQTHTTDIKNEIQYRTSEIADNVQIVMIEQFKAFKDDMEQKFAALETNIKTIEANLNKLRNAENARYKNILDAFTSLSTQIAAMNTSDSVYDFPDVVVDDDVTCLTRAQFITQSQLIESRNLLDSVTIPSESQVQ